MKLRKLSQLALVSMIGLIVATLLTACQLVTIDYVFVACSAGTSPGSAGMIYTYNVDSQSGALRQPPRPLVSSGGTNPVSLAVTSNYLHLYVANQGNNSIVHFAIAVSGALTKQDSITLGEAPVAIAVNNANTYLYVISGTTSATLTEYALNKSGAIGSIVAQTALVLPGFTSDTILPAAISVEPNNNFVYVSAYDQSAYNPGGSVTSTANPGWVFGYAVGSGGALTPTPNSPYQAGVRPSGMAPDPTNRFLYITDYASNDLIGYQIQPNGVLTFLVNGPFKTGNEPSGVTIDPRGIYLYVSNELDSSVTGYIIALQTGTPSALVNSNASAIYATDTQPVAITVDPALGRFVFTANHLGDSVSGFFLNPDSGVLTQSLQTPYPTGALPTALVSIPHGNHSIQAVFP